ncbi:TPT-domain-containing protein [Gonapodya prolifera JEL478]|uniref:TPT-domain-containing protein n=1 Tax=Gonapodya prolifera (strain JEL478) TaxID=1344416 RepID=A0A139AFK1_GONPJ|nr:TPT-domain-containing protein [Gonapodya prolifera JEL478]|eukprot:KXS15602.1 TPT-domain-containing protein [Gonapodya prolifera JEL478]
MDATFSRSTAISLGYIAVWYTLSLSLNVLNKWMFGAAGFNFASPMALTALQAIVQFCLSLVTLTAFRRWRMGPLFPPLSRYLTRELPCGLATGLDIGMANASLRYLTLSLYTMIRSGSPVTVLIFAFLFGLERVRWRLVLIIVVIVLGVALMVVSPEDFASSHPTGEDGLGFPVPDNGTVPHRRATITDGTKERSLAKHLQVVGILEATFATIFSGLRWALTQILLRGDLHRIPSDDGDRSGPHTPIPKHPAHEGSNPLVTNLRLTPLMFISIAASSLLLEGVPDFGANPDKIFGLVLLTACLAWCMTLAEYGLINHAGAVAFSIAGIFKEILALITSHYVFGDQLWSVNAVGLAVSLAGIVGYNYVKLTESTPAQLRPPIELKNSDYFEMDVAHQDGPGEDVVLDPSDGAGVGESEEDVEDEVDEEGGEKAFSISKFIFRRENQYSRVES